MTLIDFWVRSTQIIRVQKKWLTLTKPWCWNLCVVFESPNPFLMSTHQTQFFWGACLIINLSGVLSLSFATSLPFVVISCLAFCLISIHPSIYLLLKPLSWYNSIAPTLLVSPQSFDSVDWKVSTCFLLSFLTELFFTFLSLGVFQLFKGSCIR